MARTRRHARRFSHPRRLTLSSRYGCASLRCSVALCSACIFYRCGAACSSDHDEIDIEVVTNYLQPGVSPLKVQLNRYAAEPLGAGHGPIVNLPAGFDPLAYHEWKIRWGTSRLTYYVDSVELFSTTTFVPQRPMHADMIAWGPASDWSAAYDASLQPTNSQNANQSFYALVDYFTVKTVPVFAVYDRGLLRQSEAADKIGKTRLGVERIK